MLLLSDQYTINVQSMRYQSMNYCYALTPATCYRSAINTVSICHQYANVLSMCHPCSIDMLSASSQYAIDVFWSLLMHYQDAITMLSMWYHYAIMYLVLTIKRLSIFHQYAIKMRPLWYHSSFIDRARYRYAANMSMRCQYARDMISSRGKWTVMM